MTTSLKNIVLCNILLLTFSPMWSTSDFFSEAKELATSSHKNIFVNYTADWCLPCQIFKEQVLADQKVNKLLDSDFIVLTADYDDIESQEMYSQYTIACLPTLHLLDEKGNILSEMSGTMKASQFYLELSQYAMNGSDLKEESQPDTRPIPIASSMSTKISNYISEYYTLQSGAFSEWDNALSMKNKIEKSDILSPVRIVEDSHRKLYIINVGKYRTKEELLSISEQLKAAGIDHFIKRKKEYTTNVN